MALNAGTVTVDARLMNAGKAERLRTKLLTKAEALLDEVRHDDELGATGEGPKNLAEAIAHLVNAAETLREV